MAANSRSNVDTTADQLVADLAQHIRGKVVLTTGVSPSGLGATFVEAIARARPALLILAGRNTTKTQKTADVITAATRSDVEGAAEAEGKGPVPVRVLTLDLGSLAAVREAAGTVNGWDDVPAIDVLVNNAGLMAVSEFVRSPDGYESQFATNHLGHFLFTNLIMGKLLASAGRPRVVNVSSDGHRLHPIRWADHNFQDGELYSKWHAYGQSKTANMLMAVSLAEKLGPRLLALSLHPGMVTTSHLGDQLDWSVDIPALQAADRSLGNPEGWDGELKFKSTGCGAATHVYAAKANRPPAMVLEHNGAYLQDSHVADPWTETVRPWATSSVEAGRLWKLSEELVGQKFDY